jgi:CRP/FNR family cyclic AMP-dependent transcriptional regulator
MGNLSESVALSQSKRDNQLKLARSLFARALGFKDCKPETLDELMRQSSLRVLTKGEILAQHKDAFDWFGLIVEGSLEASILRKDGHRHLMHFLQPGDLVGLINIVDRKGLVNDLISRFADTVILLIPGDLVRNMRMNCPDLSSAIEVQIVFRSRLLYERLAADQSISLENRLSTLLLTGSRRQIWLTGLVLAGSVSIQPLSF